MQIMHYTTSNLSNTRNTLDCEFVTTLLLAHCSSHTSIEFGQTGNSAIQSADPENPTVDRTTRRGDMAI